MDKPGVGQRSRRTGGQRGAGCGMKRESDTALLFHVAALRGGPRAAIPWGVLSTARVSRGKIDLRSSSTCSHCEASTGRDL